MSILNNAQREDWKNRVSALDPEAKKLLRETLSKGFYFRRERQWKVFTWCSSVFAILITGLLIGKGTTALQNPLLASAATIITSALALMSVHRINQDRIQAGLRADLIAEIDRGLTAWIGDLEESYKPKRWYLGDREIIWSLHVFFLFLLWAPIAFKEAFA